VANFRFGDRKDSYAAQIGKPKNIGVIGAAYFAEYERPRMLGRGFEATRGGGGDDTYETFGGACGTTRGGGTKGVGHDVGTEFGQRTEQRVTRVQWTRGTQREIFAIEYASEENLRKAGVIIDPPLGAVNPFPGDDDKITGCQPPKGWKDGTKKRRRSPRR
jgi:hypothetical protein